MKPIFDFQTIEDKYIVMRARILSGKIAVIETCPFCHASHIHYISDSPYAVGAGIVSLGHFKANCEKCRIEIELVNGLTVNNSDGYYLVYFESQHLPDRLLHFE